MRKKTFVFGGLLFMLSGVIVYHYHFVKSRGVTSGT